MANAYRDENDVPTKIGLLNTNGTTIMRLYVNPTTGALRVNDASTGTYPAAAGNRAHKDDNAVSTMTGVSEADETTPLNFLINSSNELLVDSS